MTRKQVAAASRFEGFQRWQAPGRVRMIGDEWMTGRVRLNSADDDLLAIENEKALMMVAIRYITAIEASC
jgi:hypothetical protein